MAHGRNKEEHMKNSSKDGESSMLKIQSDRIIIDGHEPTKEQCETMTLLANALAESESFKMVKYESGYAEFEKVGKAEELKFVLDGPGSFSMYDASTGDEVLYVSSDSTSLAITFSGNELTLTAEADFMFIIKRSNSSYVESYSPSDGTGAINIPVVVKMKKQIESISEYNITFAESSGATKVSVDLTTLPGWSSLPSDTYNITIVAKADGYRDSEPSAAVSVKKAAPVYTDCITFTGESSDFTLAVGGTKDWDGIVEYSTNHNTWTVWDGSAISSSDKKLYLRGSGNTKFYKSRGGSGAKFVLSARAACSGNLNTLLEYSNPPTTLGTNCYHNMFYNCTNLTAAPELPALTLSSGCYQMMFYNCTNLTATPKLPATALALSCYDGMFRDCKGLTTATELPATTLADSCYTFMFYNCTALKISSAQSSEYPTVWRIPSSGTISSTPTNWNTSMLSGTGGTFTSNPSINTTYYGAWTSATPTLISFTIGGTSYQAEEGMTWAEWVNSSYNTGGYYVDGTAIMTPEKYIVAANLSSTINDGNNYSINGGGSGGGGK